MKKIFLFAAAAALLTACSSEELADQSAATQDANGTPVKFSVYTPRATRAGAPGEIITKKLATTGFGILAYYTDDEKYDADKSTPNFMYNTKVTSADEGSTWTYNPVMYWPNEFKTASAENTDRVSFFAYAPYVEVDNTTGIPYADQANWKNDKTLIDTEEKNITAISKNTANGNPVVKYVVDTNPATSVDLLWGVAAADGKYSEEFNGGDVSVKEGMPFIDCVKPTVSDKLSFNMCHALSQLNVDVKYIADAETPNGTSETIKPTETRIYIRSIKIGGFVMKAALDLNNKETYKEGTAPDFTYRGKALWKDFDGKSTLSTTDKVKFFDGRKDGKEGTESGDNPNESYLGLNPLLLENYVNAEWGSTNWLKTDVAKAEDKGKNRGVTAEAQNLFAGAIEKDADIPAASAPIYVIPVGDPIDITIEYDVLTADGNLSTFLSDGLTHGSMIKNIISKTSEEIFGGVKTYMEDGKSYTIHLILGMTSVKIEAEVTDYQSEKAIANLPDNK